ncbi:hypothetical protein PHET_07606 [Paragonimus heterotremus]|uniref:SAP30-binding protein n=1 Tax=Paragonimus heterotremus TaxID=100268 RepID=A0A8J4TCN1_9TREM|nr:hypothetical protein PHET_07606 [Paragonimus heterotremus]
MSKSTEETVFDNEEYDAQVIQPFYTSDDEREFSPSRSTTKQNSGKVVREKDRASVTSGQSSDTTEAADIPSKKPRLAAAASLVSYAIDEDEEDVAAPTDDEESPHASETESGKNIPELVRYSMNAESMLNSSSPHAEPDKLPFDNLGEAPTILSSDLRGPIHVPSQEQLLAAKQTESQTDVTNQSPKNATETPLDRTEIKRLLEDVQLPPEPQGHCPMRLQEKVDREVHRMRLEIDYDPNRVIQDNKAFRNPSIYEKLISFLNIDEKGTNFPPEIYNPYRWMPQSYYDELAKVQNREIDRLTKLQKEQKKTESNQPINNAKTSGNAASVGFPKVSSQPVLNTISGGSVATGFTEPKKRSKWDAGIPENTTTGQTNPDVAKSTSVVPVGSLVKQN